MVVLNAAIVWLPSRGWYKVFESVDGFLHVKIFPSPSWVQSGFRTGVHWFLGLKRIGSFTVCHLQGNYIQISGQVSMSCRWPIFSLSRAVTPVPCIGTDRTKAIATCSRIDCNHKLIDCGCETGNRKGIRNSDWISCDSTPVPIVIFHTELDLVSSKLIVSVRCWWARIVWRAVSPVPLINCNNSIRVCWCRYDID